MHRICLICFQKMWKMLSVCTIIIKKCSFSAKTTKNLSGRIGEYQQMNDEGAHDLLTC